MPAHEWHANGTDIAVQGERLTLANEGTTFASFCVAPVIDGNCTALGPWTAVAQNHVAADAGSAASVHLAMEHGRVCLWLETTQPFIRQLTCLADGAIGGNQWQTFVPDEWYRRWHIDRDVEVAASSNYLGMSVDGEDGAGMTDPGDRPPTWIFNVPAHLCAFEASADRWFGLCLPHPHALGVVRWRMERGRFALEFDAVQAACPESGCPRIYFETGLDGPLQLCDRHYRLSRELGLTGGEPARDHPDWWAFPYYKSYDDMLRTEQEEGGYNGHVKTVDGRAVRALTAERLQRWHARVEEKTGLQGRVNMFLDQVYFARYGDYHDVIPELGGVDGLRALIDAWRDRGVRTGLYLHPYTVSRNAAFCREQPDACLLENSLGVPYGHGVRVGDSGSAYLDWTHPTARAFMLDTVEFLLADRPGCLNADWLGINNTIGPDPRYYSFHDASWGVGDLMQMKVQKLIYERAKYVKPDAMVRRQSALAPYMEPFYDEAQLCEEWNGSTRAWWRRAQLATRLMKHGILGFDPWFVTLSKGYEYYQGLAAVAVPATEASSHAIHPYLSYRPLREKDIRRRRAGLQVYMNAPQRTSDEKHVELTAAGEFVGAWRKRTQGPLAGFYAARALSPRCLVTYDETRALISASESRTAELTIPPGAVLVAVERVTHDGSTVPHPYEQMDEHTLRLHIEDCAGDTLYLQIRYRLVDTES